MLGTVANRYSSYDLVRDLSLHRLKLISSLLPRSRHNRLGTAFPLLPAHAVDGAYLHPDLEDDDRARLGPISEPPRCYFVVTIHPGAEPTANLLAPIVINWPARRGVQAIQTSTAYSHQHLLRPAQPATGEGKSSIC